MDASLRTQPNYDGSRPESVERRSLRWVVGVRTELEDISEVEYRQLRSGRMVLISVRVSGTQKDAGNTMAELRLLAETADSEVLEASV